MFGAGGGTSSYREVEETDVLFLWGANARDAHPIFFHHVLKGASDDTSGDVPKQLETKAREAVRLCPRQALSIIEK